VLLDELALLGMRASRPQDAYSTPWDLLPAAGRYLQDNIFKNVSRLPG
jgi:hypothetical protein